jgi:hypothetical protein
MNKPAPVPSSPPSAPGRDEPLAAIEEMIARLSALKDREHNPDLRGSYRAVIDRLGALR